MDSDVEGSPERSHAADPALLGRVFTLLEEIWPAITAVHDEAARLGGTWARCSTPFVREARGRVIAHVGLVEAPLRVAGQDTPVGCIHAVATHPAHRGAGLASELLAAALAHADRRYRTLLLTTSAPRIYRRWGFRVLPESVFRERAPDAHRRSRRQGGARALDLGAPGDVRLLHRLLDERVPVSDLLGVRPERPIFLFNECQRPLWYLPALDVVVAMEIEGPVLRLRDVVGPRLPPLDALVAELPGEQRVLEIYFSPDRLAPPDAFVAHPNDPAQEGNAVDTFLMVRGELPPSLAPLMLPPSART